MVTQLVQSSVLRNSGPELSGYEKSMWQASSDAFSVRDPAALRLILLPRR